MRREIRADGEYTFDDDGRCVGVRVPQLMMDGKAPVPTDQDRLAAHIAGYGSRPGFIPITDEQRQQRNAAYMEHCVALSDRWRRPAPQPPSADSKPTHSPQRANDAEQARRGRDAWLSNAWRRL